MIKNKKAYNPNLFGFFFILMIISAIFFFSSFVLHYLLYDLGLVTVQTAMGGVLNQTGTAMTNISTLSSNFLGLTQFYDILFLVLMVSAFIESTIAAVRATESGFFSFFGYVTLGNVFLIFIMSFGVQIQGWFMNEIVFNILLVSISAPIITMFFNYGIYIGLFWYLWLIGVNQINFNGLKDKFNQTFKRRSRDEVDLSEGRFEE